MDNECEKSKLLEGMTEEQLQQIELQQAIEGELLAQQFNVYPGWQPPASGAGDIPESEYRQCPNLGQ